ncbi:allophanate hydrolase subunit 1 [Paenarthrobacter sp. Z7-10]|uniref:5-oxoprolinase subunit B family protein n=1 Tax=Paenarthrobacter sp. Z7-10 TaxID=2787635 RepID=UPI0022A979DF
MPGIAAGSSADAAQAGLVLLPCGDSAVLAELPDLTAVLALYRGLSVHRPSGVVDVVPAARTVLVNFDPALIAGAVVRRWLQETTPIAGAEAGTDEVRVDVNYDGPDLVSVAQSLGVSPEEVVALHTSSPWTAAFTGFAPGFAYLVTDHDRLQVPRRGTPRTVVPAGAVGLAGEFSGIYPASSPGGWQLIGHTDAVLWNAHDDGAAALIRPGTRVRFREV